MADLGLVFYEGRSLLNGVPIVGIATGLDGGSNNPKTGPIVQTWILRQDLDPMEAIRQNLDDAICGDCGLRGDGAFGRTCYVTPWQGPKQVYRRYRRGDYYQATIGAGWMDIPALLEGQFLRLGAYGDPAAIPLARWEHLLEEAQGWIGYTHQWRTCAEGFARILMASVDTEDEARVAQLRGWRTFRVRGARDPLLRGVDVDRLVSTSPIEFVCPASDEAGFRTTCARCQLCRGTSSPLARRLWIWTLRYGVDHEARYEQAWRAGYDYREAQAARAAKALFADHQRALADAKERGRAEMLRELRAHFFSAAGETDGE